MAVAEVLTPSPPPSHIGRYRLLGELGQGAMGIVYLAHDPQLDREVALKTIQLPPELPANQCERLTQNLLQEARLSAKLAHPGIVQVYDAGQESGLPYLVLERISGQTLETMLRTQGRLSKEAALKLFQPVLEAMAYAHEQGIMHRDLKPANIMVQSNGQPRVMDFGIARALADVSPVRPGGMAGTPRYMAPEQILGRSVDQRVDVFALGVLAFFLFSGKHPFPQMTLEELREAIAYSATPALGAAAPELPDAIQQWVEKALAKSPAERFSDARAAQRAFAPAAELLEGDDGSLSGSARKEMLEFIMKRIERQGDFPATAEYLMLVTRNAASQGASAQKIAEAILKDFALTNRILRLVNSPSYRGRGGAVTTISRAVVILGVDTIMGLARGLGIFEHFHNRCDVHELKLQAISSLMTALHSRQLAQMAGYPEPEEAFITGMLFHLGRLIVAFYFPQEHRAIKDILSSGERDEERACRKIMRLGYSDIAEALSESWRLPDTIRSGMTGLLTTHTGAVRGRTQQLQAIVSCAEELGRATIVPDERARKAALSTLARRYQQMLPINADKLKKCTDDAIKSAMDISHALKVDLQSLGVASSLIESQDVARLELGGAADPLEASVRPLLEFENGVNDSGEATPEEQRQDIIMRTVMEITTAMMQPFQISDIIMMVLEAMFRGLSFNHVMLAMVNPQRDHVYCRFGLGPDIDAIRKVFHFPLNEQGGLPARCILEGREIALLNVFDRRRDLEFPKELIGMLKSRSVVLIPIVIQQKPIGCFFVSRTQDQPEPSRTDLRDLRTLANQAVLAIQQSLIRR